MSAIDYDREYSRIPDYFGSEPEELLTQHVHLIDDSLPVLDIGAGQGRHSFYLACRNYRVIAIDPSQVAVDGINRIVEKEKLPIDAKALTFEDLYTDPESFSAVVVCGLIQMIDWDKIKLLIKRIDNWLAPGGYLFITAWTIADSSYEIHQIKSKPIGKNSFRTPAGQVYTFLEKNELKSIFSGYEPVYYHEGWGKWHTHGDGDPERHARAEGVFRKA